MEDRQFNRVAKGRLADPQRFALLQQIASGASCGEEIACKALVEHSRVTPATISHHLKELSNAGLIEGRKEGQCMYLRACPGVWSAYLEEVGRRLSAKSK